MSTNILNLLEQLKLEEPKPVEEESESEDEDEYFGEPTVSGFSHYDIILIDHWGRFEGGPSRRLIDAIKILRKTDGDCDFCILAGVDKCPLHRADITNETISRCRDLVNNAGEKDLVTVHFNGMAFGDDFCEETNRKVFTILGDYEFLEAIEDENIINGKCSL